MVKPDKLRQEILAERENIEQTFLFLEEAIARSEIGVVELTAIGSFVHNIYNGIENILKRSLKFKRVNVADSPSSHKDLLDQAVAAAIISHELSEDLDEYRGFRHFFVHAYAFMIREAQLLPLAMALPELWHRFEAEITDWLTNIAD